jgi:hypothetical protein
MPIINTISDGEGTNRKAGVQKTELFGQGLKVYTYNGVTRQHSGKFFLNETYGSAMNQNAAPSGIPDQIHNGIDTVLWTASAIGGTWTFDSTAQAFAGTRSIDATATVNGDIAEIDKGSTVTAADYESLTGYIYITSWPSPGTKEVRIYCWDTGTASQVGSTIDLSNYIDNTTLNSWQQFTIPLTDLSGTADFDAIRIETIDVGPQQAPDYYLDNLQLEQAGGTGTLQYISGPQPDEIWKVYSIHITMADAYAGTVTDGTLPNIPYDGFLGVNTLSSGINIQNRRFGDVQETNTFRDFIDMIATFTDKDLIYGGDGTNTWFSLNFNFSKPILLIGENQDDFLVNIADDLSGLLFFKMSLSYSIKVEEL